jgi:hypothetical protein
MAILSADMPICPSLSNSRVEIALLTGFSSDNPNQWGDPQKTGLLCLNVSKTSVVIIDSEILAFGGMTCGYADRQQGRRCLCSPAGSLLGRCLIRTIS